MSNQELIRNRKLDGTSDKLSTLDGGGILDDDAVAPENPENRTSIQENSRIPSVNALAKFDLFTAIKKWRNQPKDSRYSNELTDSSNEEQTSRFQESPSTLSRALLQDPCGLFEEEKSQG